MDLAPTVRSTLFSCLAVLLLAGCQPQPAAEPQTSPEPSPQTTPEPSPQTSPEPSPLPPAEPAPEETPETSERWQAVWEDARRRGVDFRGLGQEPGWYVEVKEGEEVLLVADYGERQVTTGAPAREDGPGGQVTYRARTADGQALAVAVEPTACSDSMSGIPFPATVVVNLDDREYRGCGRFLR